MQNVTEKADKCKYLLCNNFCSNIIMGSKSNANRS